MNCVIKDVNMEKSVCMHGYVIFNNQPCFFCDENRSAGVFIREKEISINTIVIMLSEIIRLLDQLMQSWSWTKTGYPVLKDSRGDRNLAYHIQKLVGIRGNYRRALKTYQEETGKTFPSIKTVYEFNKKNPNCQEQWSELGEETTTHDTILSEQPKTERMSVFLIGDDPIVGAFYEATDRLTGRKYILHKPTPSSPAIQMFSDQTIQKIFTQLNKITEKN